MIKIVSLLIFLIVFHLAYCQNGYPYPSSLGYGEEEFNGYSYGNENQMVGSISGVPGVDYPIYSIPPETSFRCDDQRFSGYYADPEAQCQSFHICQSDGRADTFLCPNGTIFHQEYLVCDWWYNVDCSQAQEFYGVNEFIQRAMQEATDRLLREAIEKARQGSGYSYPSSRYLPTGYK